MTPLSLGGTQPDRDPRVDPRVGDTFQKGALTKRITEIRTSTFRAGLILYRETCTHGPRPETTREGFSGLPQFREWARDARVIW
jgi:hypothetical protein